MNWGLLGHEWAVDLLREHVSQQRIRHAYLITGPVGIGRRTLALRLAQAVNCLQPPGPGEACLGCRACVLIERMQHPDLAVVQAEQPGGVLKVDQIRSLQHDLALAPYEANYRVALLLRFEEAHASAANALLKVLEEPPARVLLVLTAESAESLLPTIVSRCEVLRLRPLALDRLTDGLQSHWDLPFDRARLFAHLSGGRPGLARRYFQEPERGEQRQIRLDDHARLLSAGLVERFAYAEGLAKEKDQVPQVLQGWLSLWRDVLLHASGANVPITNLDREEEIRQCAAEAGLESAKNMVAGLGRILDLLGRNVNTRLALEVLMLELPVVHVRPPQAAFHVTGDG